MTSRIPPLPPGDWPPEMRDALAALVPPEPRHPLPSRDADRPKGLNILGTFAHHPALARAYHTFNGHVLFASTLSPRHRELVVLRVAAVRDADYEWAQHVVIAGDLGITADEIAAVAVGPDADPGREGWSDLEAALLRAADELVRDADLSDTTWAALSAEFGPPEILDLIFTVGAYDLLAMAMRALRIELDDDLPPASLP